MSSDDHSAAAVYGSGEVRAPARDKTANFRNRIKGLRRVRAGDLIPNPNPGRLVRT